MEIIEQMSLNVTKQYLSNIFFLFKWLLSERKQNAVFKNILHFKNQTNLGASSTHIQMLVQVYGFYKQNMGSVDCRWLASHIFFVLHEDSVL